MSIVIVGASAAGLSVAQQLRGFGFDGDVTLVGTEVGTPYDRPPLTKQVLSGAWLPERARLMTEQRMAALNVNLVLGTRACAVDRDRRDIVLDNGDPLRYEALVVATGASPRRLPNLDSGASLPIRTMNDALRAKKLIREASQLVVIGAGFLGLEVAATAKDLGVSVTVLELASRPLDSRLGAITADRLLELHRSNGVEVHTGVSGLELDVATDAEPGAVPVRVTWQGGCVDADVVVEAIGCTPEVSWLESSGLALSDGVVCDQYCAAADGVWAAGDVARWWHPYLNRHLRLENRTNATEQGRAVAENILGHERPYSPTPYFWTDQFGVRIQVVGVIPDQPVVERVGDTPDVVELLAGGELAAVVGWNSPKVITRYRQSLVYAQRDALC